jgi:hypothetical protein
VETDCLWNAREKRFNQLITSPDWNLNASLRLAAGNPQLPQYARSHRAQSVKMLRRVSSKPRKRYQRGKHLIREECKTNDYNTK